MYKMKKFKNAFRHVLKLYRRKQKYLTENTRKEIRDTLNELQEAILNKETDKARECAGKAESLRKLHFKKSPFDHVRDSVVALVFALVVAIIIRSVWFEFYEIPTGSMRPTFEEKDRLVVSKTTFGINIPLMRGHFYFNPRLVKRNGIFIFTGAGMDIADVNTLYFYLFPGKKQYIKRLIGKPGDVLYFYGGMIYGINHAGEDITDKLQLKTLEKIDHVPYIHLNGKTLLSSQHPSGISSLATLKQMNEAVAQLSVTSLNKVEGKMLSPYSDNFHDYYDLWGFKNYGMGRLLTKQEMISLTNTPISQVGDAPLYMEIIHHPSILHPMIVRGYQGKLHPSVSTNSAVLPLQEKHLKSLFENIYTARFTVKNGTIYRFGSSVKPGSPCTFCPKIKEVPDGTYEYYYGKGYKVLWGGIRKKLPANHPLLQFSHERLQLLYNLGIECNTLFAPYSKDQFLLPSRYIYFRNGDLYTMGAPFMTKEEPTLVDFIQREYLKQASAPSYRPYIPFDDAGPPIKKDGKIDADFIRQYGIAIPASHYLALGDNYAMSADSRDFGFVPESNIRGAPTFIFWPPGNRFGKPEQVLYPFLNSPRFAVWCLALAIAIAWWIYHRRHHQLPIEIE